MRNPARSFNRLLLLNSLLLRFYVIVITVSVSECRFEIVFKKETGRTKRKGQFNAVKLKYTVVFTDF